MRLILTKSFTMRILSAGVAIDGTNHEDFSVSVDKQELFRLSDDAV
ncbi:hypothetical protein G9U52_22065 [Paenibacillus sp. S3N08]|uniref:Uncharacterized protein n=1 Tax=Paenibacillus agricola TaxID=2716264 RepID=A0ABX0JCD6_9BACL|nr:hypothetical protein [Paenibacillus agricola]